MSENEQPGNDPLAPIGGVLSRPVTEEPSAAFTEAVAKIDPAQVLAAEQEQGVPVPEPVKKAQFTDVHTPVNTTMTTPVPPKPSIVRELTDEEKASGGFMTIFLGHAKSDIVQAQQLVSRWLQVESVRSWYEEDRTDITALNAAEATWSEFIESHYPGKKPDEMTHYAKAMYQYLSEVQDEVRVRSRVMTEQGISNLSDRGNYITGDVVAQSPSRKTQGFKVSQVMRRGSARAGKDVLQFDVLLRDSYVKLNFMRPNKMELGELLNDIRRTVTGYVRTINNNNAVLARIATMKVIWDFIAKRVHSCSISDIVDFNDLVNFITITDMDRLTTALLESFNTRGVNMNLRCLNNACDWETFGLVDPSTLNQNRPGVSAEDAALYANLFNGRVKMTSAETHAKRRASRFGIEDNRVYNDNRSLYLEIAIPTLGEAFATFEYFISQVNVKLADLRAKITDKDEYDAQVAMTYANLGATEYMHWVTTYVDLATPGTEEEDIVVHRHETEDYEFDMGLWTVITDNDDFNRNLTRFILNKTPYMSRHFTGVQNYECPKCKTNSADHQDPNKFLERLPGYTPIDAIMSFFILSQLKMLSQVVESKKVMDEVRSE